MSVNHSSEYNILGCNVRISADEKNNAKALSSVNLLREEIMQLREERPGLRDIDLAVMSALRIATKLQDIEDDFKENMLSLKSGVEDAIHYIEQVSPGAVAAKQTH